MNMQILRRGDEVDRDALLRKLVSIQYTRNDQALGRGTFRVRGETLEVFPAYAETAFRATLFGDDVERLQHFDPLTGELIEDDLEHIAIWPATHYNVKEGTIDRSVEEIGEELNEQTAKLEAEGKLLESHRLRQRTQYDMEMLREVGLLQRHRELLAHPRRPPAGRRGRTACSTTSPRTSSASSTSPTRRCRRSAACTRATARASRRSSTTGSGSRRRSTTGRRRSTSSCRSRPSSCSCRRRPASGSGRGRRRIVEQIVRPTGIVDPMVDVRETRNQIDDLMNEIRKRVDREERDARHHAHEEDERGPHRLPARDGLPGALPALGDRHAGAHPDHPPAAPRRVRRARRREPAPRGPRPPRGVARRDPRRRQGGLPPRRDVADPDDRPRGPQRRRHGDHVRRQGDRGDEGGAGGDRPPPRDPGRLQRGARDHRADDRQGHLGHRGLPATRSPRSPASAGASVASAAPRSR